MREFVVNLDYAEGTDPVMDVFIQHPLLVSNSVDITIGGGSLTRVDRVSGPPEGIAALKSVYLDCSICNECGAPSSQGDTDSSYEILIEGETNVTIYTRYDEFNSCNSVPYHAIRLLPPGLLFDSQRRANRHQWRILIPIDETLSEFYETIKTAFPDGVTVSFQRLTTPRRWGSHTGTVADLSPEQRTAIEEAVRMNYYDTPRGTTLADIASELGVPQSTLRYRLRRAEAWLTASSFS
jgi:hypothetical protein